MTKQDKIDLLKLLDEKERRVESKRLFTYYPDIGPLRRELYPKHLEFFEAGKTYRERLALAANRVGKTEGMGGYETTVHLTGLYPKWWPGIKFDEPIDAWAAGDTSETVKDIIQEKLLGPFNKIGTGLIPKDRIVDITRKMGVPEAVKTIYIRTEFGNHKKGEVSQISLKSYDQKRKSFQGTKKQIIWLDEEPPIDIYGECLLRTMDTSGDASKAGLIYLTFTPLKGLSDVVLSFMPGGKLPEEEMGTKKVIMATWDDVPHLSQNEKDALWASIPPYQRDARSKGVPQLGSGAIYPVPESDIVVNDFEIPDFWPRFYSMDVGWNRTSVGWHAIDRENDIVYRYGEHYRGEAEPSVHADAIKSRGSWIPGVIDPAARGRSQKDGQMLLQSYLDLGLDLQVAFNGVESGIYEMWQRLSTGRYKVFKSCQNWLGEYRIYRRDEKGKIVKTNDHAMDESRYGIMSGIDRAKTKPVKKEDEYFGAAGSGSWMA